MFVTQKVRLKQFVAGAVVFLVAGLAAQAQIYISGNIYFSGGAVLNTNIASATAFTSVSGTITPNEETGAYSPLAGNESLISVTFNPLTFSPSPSSPTNFWTFSYNAITYSFDIASTTVVYQDSNFLSIMANGTATITGGATAYLPTTGTLAITGNTADPTSLNISFASSVHAVPEPGVFSFLMVGGLLLGGRMFAKKQRV